MVGDTRACDKRSRVGKKKKSCFSLLLLFYVSSRAYLIKIYHFAIGKDLL